MQIRTTFDRVANARVGLSCVIAAAMILGAHLYSNANTSAPVLYDHGTIGVDGEPIATLAGNHWIVTAAPETAAALAARDDVTAIGALGGDQYAVSTDLDAEAVAAITGTQPEADAIGALDAVPGPQGPWQWALNNTGQDILGVHGTPGADVDAEAAFDAAITGSGVVVAVLDSGVDFSHPDLNGAAWSNHAENCTNGIDDDHNGYIDDCSGWDFANNDNTPFDPAGAHYHGTHVASIIAARHGDVGMAGLAPAAKIMPIKITNSTTFTLSNVATAIRYAVDNDADIINLSLSSTATSTPLRNAIDYAESAGVLVVTSAGNRSQNIDTTPAIPATYPNANIVAVANSDQHDQLDTSSSYGPVAVDLAAPGDSIIGAMPGGTWAYASGTSMSTPLVSAAAALLYSKNPALSPAALRNQLLDSAERLPALTGKVSTGRLDVAALLGLPDPDDPPVTAPPAGDTIAFDNFNGIESGTPFDARIVIDTDSDLVHRAEAQLFSLDGPTAAIQAHPVTVGATPTITDTTGTFSLTGPRASASATAVTLRSTLPAGRYAVVVSLPTVADPLELVAEPAVAIFDVTTPAPPPSTTTVPGSPPNTATPTTTVPGAPATTAPGTPATTVAPSPGVTTTVPSGPAPTMPPHSTTTAPGAPTTVAPNEPSTPPATTPSTVAPNEPAPTTTVAPPPTPPVTVPATTTTVAPPAPTTTAPSVTAPTTTVAPSAPVTVPPDPAPPVSDGPWAITSINPNHCPTRTECAVTITGSFPRTPNVWFGSVVVPSTAVSRTATQLRVTVPASVHAGTVDVALRDHDVNLVQPDGFTFTGTSPAPTTTIAPGGPTTTTPTAPTTTTAPGNGSSTTIAPTTTTTVPASRTWRRDPVTVDSSSSRNGLTVAVVTSPPELAALNTRTDTCRAARCAGGEL